MQFQNDQPTESFIIEALEKALRDIQTERFPITAVIEEMNFAIRQQSIETRAAKLSVRLKYAVLNGCTDDVCAIIGRLQELTDSIMARKTFEPDTTMSIYK